MPKNPHTFQVRIGIPIAYYHPGTTGEYAARAFRQLGHEAQVLSSDEFCAASHGSSFDFFFCVDSGEPMNLSNPLLNSECLKRTSFWFIDFRHNKHRETRNPPDFEIAKTLHEGGGWIFQSQYQDADYCVQNKLDRVSWLPLAADTEIWSDAPAVQKDFHIGFTGHVWDLSRRRALELLMNTQGLRFAFRGHGQAWKEDGAALLRRCVAGFNINSYFGEPYAYDLNMRVFETLSCGVPLITNLVPALSRIFPENAQYIRTFRSLDEILPVVADALNDPSFVNSGSAAREFIVRQATYVHRMREALSTVASLR